MIVVDVRQLNSCLCMRSTAPTYIPGQLCFSSALIAGVVVSLLLVLLLLLLVGGVLAVVVKARRKKKGKETVRSQSNVEDGPTKTKDVTDNVDSFQNVRGQPTQTSRHYNDTYDYATAEYAFINPASATASFSANVYDSTDYSEVDQRLLAAGGEGHCEEFRVEEKWSGGGCNEDPIKGVISKQKKSALKDSSKVLTLEELYAQPDKARTKKNASTKVMKPEELYAQPDKAKKKKKKKNMREKDIEVTSEEVAVPCDDLYAQPDMTKKKDKRGQQHWEQESEERKLVPTAPLPCKKHVEVMQEVDEDKEDIPEVPPPFVPDGEEYYNTKCGAGPPTQDGNFDYAVVDRKNK